MRTNARIDAPGMTQAARWGAATRVTGMNLNGKL